MGEHYVNGEALTDTEKTRMRHLKLNQFHSRYTSEDNFSFSEIMYKNKLRHFAKYSWIYEQQKNANQRQKYLSILQKQNEENTSTKCIQLSSKIQTKQTNNDNN